MFQNHLEGIALDLDLLDTLLEGLEEDQDHQELAEVEDLLLLIVQEDIQLLAQPLLLRGFQSPLQNRL